jgi:hypothetical protein
MQTAGRCERITLMTAKTPRTNRRAGGVSAEEFVPLQTRVPVDVRDHYRRAAQRRGVSLSLYFELLAAVDPLAREDSEKEKKAGEGAA